jgi:hypothetical protein
VINGVVAMQNLATKAGKNFTVRAVLWTQGETDFLNSSLTYYNDLKTLQTNLQTDIQSITRQITSVPFIFSQLSANETQPRVGNLYTCPDGQAACVDDPTGAAAPLATIAQWKLQHDFPNLFYLTGPKYQYTYPSNGSFHLDTPSYSKLGAESAIAAKRLFLDGNAHTYAGVYPASISLSGSTITATFYTPNSECLTTDTTTVPNPHRNGVYDTVGKGFQFFQTGSSLKDNACSGSCHNGGITDVSISGCRQITITLSGTPAGTNQRLAYAFEGERNANTPQSTCTPDATTCNGASVQPWRGTLHGNIRTVNDFTNFNGYAVAHWLIHFNEAIGYGWAGH